MISILLSTMSRPESFKKMCLPVLENATEPNDIEFINYCEKDDKSVYEYVSGRRRSRMIYRSKKVECDEDAKLLQNYIDNFR